MELPLSFTATRELGSIRDVVYFSLLTFLI